MADTKRVIPIESNPEIFSSLAHNIGLSPILAFQDVYSITDPDLLAFLPRPVMGVTMLFPITEKYEEYRKHQDEINLNQSKGAHWFKQTVANGCGFYAILHILANLPRDLIIENLILNKLLLLQLSDELSVEEISSLVETYSLTPIMVIKAKLRHPVRKKLWNTISSLLSEEKTATCMN